MLNVLIAIDAHGTRSRHVKISISRADLIQGLNLRLSNFFFAWGINFTVLHFGSGFNMRVNL